MNSTEFKIKNYTNLTVNGDTNAREMVLGVVDSVLKALNSEIVINKAISLKGEILSIGENQWDLRERENIYVVGGGKACNSMVKALSLILGERVTKGIAIVKFIDPEDVYPNIDIYEGGHPIPNRKGYEASLKLLDLVSTAGPGDLFISMISGGSSALMSCPVEGISLEDEMEVSRIMLQAGARIMEINAVRRHISRLNGGRLAQKILATGAELVNLIIWDIVGDNLKSNLNNPSQFFGTPVGADNTTVIDANRAIEKYRLADLLPSSVVAFLKSEKQNIETPKQLDGRVTHYVLQVPADVASTAQYVCEQKQIPSYVLTTSLEGESRELGVFLSSIVKEVLHYGRPVQSPCFLVIGGESTVRVDKSNGKGGPNQEVAISFAREINGLNGVCMAAIGTDGTDGPTDFAGGIVDGETARQATLAKIDLDACLESHESYNALAELKNGIITGNTGTNLCDFILIYIPGELHD